MRSVLAPRVIALALLALAVSSICAWVVTREALPGHVRFASAETGGLYHRVLTQLSSELGRREGCRTELQATPGSVANLELLRAGAIDIAILQATSVADDDIAVIAPLYEELVHVIVRRGSGLTSVREFAGRRILLGREGSGMRTSAFALLAHYRIDPTHVAANEGYFTDLLTDPSLDGAIVTTGIDNPDLERLLATNEFKLLAVDDAQAISLRNPLFHPRSAPRGLYNEGPPLPSDDLLTIATTALLVARADAGAPLVRAAASALYETKSLQGVPLTIEPADAAAQSPLPLHPATQALLNPYEGLETLVGLLDAVSGIKELLVGIAALGYLAWDQRRRLRARARATVVHEQKERLDAFLERTVAIERAQMHTTEIAALHDFLDQVTLIKLEALEELTHEDLRADQMFSIFLMQCANLIRKIQSKILAQQSLAH